MLQNPWKNKKNNCACDVNVNENNIYLENKYLKESINTQQGEIMFLRNELLSRNKTIEMLIGDKNKTENSKRHAITVNLDTENINSQIPIKEKKSQKIITKDLLLYLVTASLKILNSIGYVKAYLTMKKFTLKVFLAQQ